MTTIDTARSSRFERALAGWVSVYIKRKPI